MYSVYKFGYYFQTCEWDEFVLYDADGLILARVKNVQRDAIRWTPTSKNIP